MKNAKSGIALGELLIIVSVFVVATVFILPKISQNIAMSQNDLLIKDVNSYLYSALQICNLESKGGKATCNTVNDIINYLSYEQNNIETNTLTLLNQTEVKYKGTDRIKNGTDFIVTMPDSKSIFTIHMAGNGIFSTAKYQKK